MISYVYLTSQVLQRNITIGDFDKYNAAVTTYTGTIRDILLYIVQIPEYHRKTVPRCLKNLCRRSC